MAKTTVLKLLDSLSLISRKIWVTGGTIYEKGFNPFVFMISGWRKSVAALQQCQIGLKNGNEVWNSKMAKTDITLIPLWGQWNCK